MAVSSFIRGKKYRFHFSDYDYNEGEFSIPFRYAKIVGSSSNTKFVVEYTSLSFLSSDLSNNVIFINNNQEGLGDTYGDIIDIDGATSIDYIDFIYDYPPTDYEINEIDDILKGYCDLLENETFSQVSIFNAYSNQWVDLPCASEYTGIATTVVNSGRNVEAVVIAEVIASDIAKVEMKWNFLTIEQYTLIAQLFEPKYHGEFMNATRFFDVVKGDFDGDNTTPPNTTTNRCRIMYCGDRKVSFAKMKVDEFGKPIGYQGVSLNLIDTHKIYGNNYVSSKWQFTRMDR